MKRAGFTMIELIFVIVILGILAAVAIPKLAATRDDAKISKLASNAATALADMGSYYTSQGVFGTLADMTNVSFGTTAAPTATNTDLSGGATVNITDGTNVCLTFATTAAGVVDGNVTISAPAAPTGNVCQAIAVSTLEMQKTHTFGGKGVVY